MDKRKLLGLRIKELRKAAGLTQDELSELVNIEAKHLSRIEVGRGYPSLDTLDKMAVALQIEMKDFFEYEHLLKSSSEIISKINTLLKEADLNKLRTILKVLRAIIK